MKFRKVVLSEAVVFRNVGNELIAIHTRTGKFHYFSKETASFFAVFKRATTLNDFFDLSGLTGSSEETVLEQHYLGALLEQMISLGLFEEAVARGPEASKGGEAMTKINYQRPEYLRVGETNLDEVTFAFLYP